MSKAVSAQPRAEELRAGRRDKLRGAEARPAVRVRVRLELRQCAIDGRREERQPADGVVEGGHVIGADALEQLHVGRLVQELRLRDERGARVAAYCARCEFGERRATCVNEFN